METITNIVVGVMGIITWIATVWIAYNKGWNNGFWKACEEWDRHEEERKKNKSLKN